MTPTETPIILTRKAEQELRAMAKLLGLPFEEILASFRKRYWIVPAGSVDLGIFSGAADVPKRRIPVESPSGFLEDLLYENLNGRLHARGFHEHTVEDC